MGRNKDDRVWQEFEQTNDGITKCKHCGVEFRGKPSATRLRSHLSGVEGFGIRSCNQVPEDVKNALANAFTSSKRPRIESSSAINNNEFNNQGGQQRLQEAPQHIHECFEGSDTSACYRRKDACRTGPYPSSNEEVQPPDPDFFEGIEGIEEMINQMMQPDVNSEPPDPSSNEKIQRKEEDIMADGSNKRPRVISTSALPQQNYRIENQVHDGERMEAQDISEGLDMDNTRHGISETKADALLTTELVGREFQENVEKIYSSIMKDEILRVGIYGMGGVGKTGLAKHVHNKLLESQNFHQVYRVNVSPDRSLQDAIAKAVKLDLSNEDDENKRAVILSKKLIEKKKCVLFLDDVWSDTPLDTDSVPVILNGCKVILTTRSLDVCRRMDCEVTMKVKCLRSSGEIEDWDADTGYLCEETEDIDEDEDWTLFRKIMGGKTKLRSELKQIAKSIVKECEGLPLMIISMARRMKGVDDMHDWRNALEDLKGARWMEDHEEVFQKLKQSYIHLKNPVLQQCLLYCAMFCEIDKEVLIEHLIVEGIVEGMSSRQAAVDKGHALLNQLQNACLLDYKYGDLYMHGLIRHMAIKVMKESTPSMVEVGRQLTSPPLQKWWKEDIARVSLMNNDIREIPSHCSPRCPNLSTLILCNNTSMKSIAENFFDGLHGLKVLNLSSTKIEKLPKSVAELKNLTALIFRHCERLTSLPSLLALGALEMLDLYKCTEFEEVPRDLGSLFNLNYLNLLCTQVKDLPAGILTNLSHLGFLGFHESSGEVKVKAKELGRLCNLETLFWRFNDQEDFNDYMRTVKQQLSHYVLFVGPMKINVDRLASDFERYESRNGLYFRKCNMSGELLLPKDVQKLDIADVTIHNGRSLCLKNTFDLKEFNIEGCKEIEYLFCLSSSPKIFETLEVVVVRNMGKLSGLFSREDADDGSPQPAPIPIQLLDVNTFSRLKKFTIQGCHNMKKLFPCGLLSNFQNLQELTVRDCCEMEEICWHLDFKLPNLRRLNLWRLPKLKSICNAACFDIIECPALRFYRPQQLSRGRAEMEGPDSIDYGWLSVLGRAEMEAPDSIDDGWLSVLGRRLRTFAYHIRFIWAKYLG